MVSLACRWSTGHLPFLVKIKLQNDLHSIRGSVSITVPISGEGDWQSQSHFCWLVLVENGGRGKLLHQKKDQALLSGQGWSGNTSIISALTRGRDHMDSIEIEDPGNSHFLLQTVLRGLLQPPPAGRGELLTPNCWHLRMWSFSHQVDTAAGNAANRYTIPGSQSVDFNLQFKKGERKLIYKNDQLYLGYLST